MNKQFIWETDEFGYALLIKLHQQGKNKFTVTYGKQIDANLSYADAASKLGEALMHALACEGKLNND